ncbi:RluA family pseudouridine synthase [Treponema pectinovorum]|uniref:RluA family pseudouridine synthase n=1 Tax=Treponema pectinovorum TaxID=164 RepID=UPI0011CCA775|nr:RluA family pseudouridine synthase [Treponema pectinovorum]
MDFVIFTAGKDDDNRRLDVLVRKFLKEESLAQLYKSIRNGFIKVNGQKKEGKYRVLEGDNISFASFLIKNQNAKEVEKHADAKDFPTLDKKIIILRTDDFLFLNKPYDIPVQKANKNDLSLDSLVENERKITEEAKSLAFKTGPLHRLDRLTTGLIAFSQSLQGARWFSAVMKDCLAKKTYFALVQGKMTKEYFWQDRISRQKITDKGFHTVSVNSKIDEGKISYTKAKPLGTGSYKGLDVTLVKFEILTGRTHQIRATSSSHGYPLLADTAYGAKKIDSRQKLYLHSYSLDLPKNDFALPETIIAPLNEEFLKMVELSLINWNGKL